MPTTGEMPVRLRIAAVDRVSKVMDSVAAKFPQLSAAARKANTTFSVLEATTDRFSKTLKNRGRQMTDAGRTMSAMFTLPATLAAGFSVKSFAEYETALVGVGKTSNIQGAELEALGEKFRNVSREVPVSVKELLELGKTSAQLGVTGADNILNFSQVLGKLSRATNIVGEEGASDLARFMTVTHTSMSQVENMASALVELGNTSAATEGEILSFASRLGSSTALFNVTATQSLGIATALKSVGIEAEAGSSAVQRALGEMNEAISKGGTKAQVLSQLTGIAMKDLKTQFKTNAAGVLRDFAAGLARVEKGGGDVTQALAYFGMTGVRDIQTVGALSKNVDLLDKKMRTAADAFQANIALQREFAATTGTLDSQWQLLKNDATDLGIRIGQFLLPSILSLVGGMRDLIGFFREHPAIMKFAVVIGGILAVVGPLLVAVGYFVGTVLPLLITGFGAVVTAAEFFGVALAVLTLPISATAIAISALFATLWVYKDVIAKYFVIGFQALGDAIGWVVSQIGGAITAMQKFLGMGGQTVNVGVDAQQKTSAQAQGARGVSFGAASMMPAANPEFSTQTNNARVELLYRGPPEMMVSTKQKGDFVSINNGLVGAFQQ